MHGSQSQPSPRDEWSNVEYDLQVPGPEQKRLLRSGTPCVASGGGDRKRQRVNAPLGRRAALRRSPRNHSSGSHGAPRH